MAAPVVSFASTMRLMSFVEPHLVHYNDSSSSGLRMTRSGRMTEMTGGRPGDSLGRPPAVVVGQTPRQGVRVASRLSFFFRELKFCALALEQNLEVARVYSTLKTAFPAATYLS